MVSGPYLTPNRFALGGYGIDISTMSKSALAQTLQRATTQVNTWCNGVQVPVPFDFRGGAVADELHTWGVADPLVAIPGWRRIYVYQKPLRTVTAFSIQFTNTYSITLTTDQLFVNTSESWAEIIATQPTIIGYPPLGYWFGLDKPQAQISYTYGYRQPITDDILEAFTPTLYYASQGQWLAGGDVTVQIDGVTQDPGDYTVKERDGAILFATAPAPNTEVTASYTATMPDAIAQATGLIAVDLLGKSRFAARGLIGLQSLKVAEVAITAATGKQPGDYVTKNGIVIPSSAAVYLAPYALGSVA